MRCELSLFPKLFNTAQQCPIITSKQLSKKKKKKLVNKDTAVPRNCSRDLSQRTFGLFCFPISFPQQTRFTFK